MAEQIFQVAVKGVIRNKKGEILMIHMPKWGHNPAHWDLPGGRMDPGETFLQTLARELQEEIGTSYTGTPIQLMGMLTNITIPVEQKLLPLIFIIYEVNIRDIAAIRLADATREDKLEWFEPRRAAELMAIKFSADFCDLIRRS